METITAVQSLTSQEEHTFNQARAELQYIERQPVIWNIGNVSIIDNPRLTRENRYIPNYTFVLPVDQGMQTLVKLGLENVRFSAFPSIIQGIEAIAGVLDLLPASGYFDEKTLLSRAQEIDQAIALQYDLQFARPGSYMSYPGGVDSRMCVSIDQDAGRRTDVAGFFFLQVHHNGPESVLRYQSKDLYTANSLPDPLRASWEMFPGPTVPIESLASHNMPHVQVQRVLTMYGARDRGIGAHMVHSAVPAALNLTGSKEIKLFLEARSGREDVVVPDPSSLTEKELVRQFEVLPPWYHRLGYSTVTRNGIPVAWRNHPLANTLMVKHVIAMDGNHPMTIMKEQSYMRARLEV